MVCVCSLDKIYSKTSNDEFYTPVHSPSFSEFKLNLLPPPESDYFLFRGIQAFFSVYFPQKV